MHPNIFSQLKYTPLKRVQSVCVGGGGGGGGYATFSRCMKNTIEMAILQDNGKSQDNKERNFFFFILKWWT